MIQKHSEILSDELITLSVESEYPEFIFPEEPIPPVKPIPPVEPIPPVKILDNQWATVSPIKFAYDDELIFPEDPIPPVESIPPVDPIFPGASLSWPADWGAGIAIDVIAPVNFVWSPDILPINHTSPVNPTSSVDPLTGMSNNPTVNTPQPKKVTGLYNAGLDINLSTGIPGHVRVTATIKVELSKFIKNRIEEDEVDIFLQSTVWGIDGNVLNGGDDRLFSFSDQLITGDGNFTFSTIVRSSTLNEDHSLLNNTDEISASIRLVCFEPGITLDIKTMTPIVGGNF